MDGQQLFFTTLRDWTPQDEATVLKMDYEARARVAKTIACAGLLIDLSLDQHTIVRESVAQNKNTPMRTLRRLAEEDLSSSVKQAAQRTLSSLI
ncbi:hypothetical protein [Planomicrobium sp. YIM 101495]|uniref:hypothetical protein n=1 Tax=Planomicrobium sp. YIM 101495 TaxID=2665160 RepID=UPI0012B8CED3|nr:hypothetical protein [Planomicrobium sp. YIM 101495]MTD30506.1 hypothetical protein [Planomicrobium sp. YIM 101495]